MLMRLYCVAVVHSNVIDFVREMVEIVDFFNSSNYFMLSSDAFK